MNRAEIGIGLIEMRRKTVEFLFWGDGEEMGVFNPTIHTIVEFVGREILWELPKTEEAETPKATIVVN